VVISKGNADRSAGLERRKRLLPNIGDSSSLSKGSMVDWWACGAFQSELHEIHNREHV
jgi:hypothetical protein